MENSSLNGKSYIVAFVDLMGQKELYRTVMNGCVESGEGSINGIDFMYQTLKALRSLSGTIADPTPHPFSKQSSPEAQKQLDKMNNIKCHLFPFSDSIQLYAPLTDDNDYIGVVSAVHLLSSVANIFWTIIYHRQPIRAGIAFGPGFETGDGDLGGPVVAEAHNMESQVAQYPRIALSESVERYLRGVVNQLDTEILDFACYRSLAVNYCLNFVEKDDDEVFIYDFAYQYHMRRDFYSSFWEEEYKDTTLLNSVLTFALEQKDYFRGIDNIHIAQKYERLENYLVRTIQKVSLLTGRKY